MHRGFLITAVTLCLFSNQHLIAQHSDVEVAIEGGAVEVHARVTEGKFGSELNPANTTDDPGFAPEGAEDLNPTTTFVAGQQLAFETVNLGSSGLNLWYWNGVGTPAFGASPHDLNIARTGAGSIYLSSGNGGFTMFAADSQGFFDEHLDYTLNASSPNAGVYVFGMRLSSPNASPAVAPSDPVFFVMASQGLDEVIHETAVDFITTSLVPEPVGVSTILIALCLMYPVLVRRNR